MTNLKIKFVDLAAEFKENKIIYNKLFNKVGESGQYVLGHSLKNFEKFFANFCDTKFAIGVNSGSDALVLSLRALKIGYNDEVILPVNSFIATAWAVAAVGAKPIYCDIQEDLNIDPNKIESLLTKKTKAIITVHLTGKPAEMSKILELAKKHDLFVIEDAAQAVGSTYKKKKVGSFGHTAAFSLHPLKNLNVLGDGGVITTDSKKIYNHILKDRNHGLIDRNTSTIWGLNSRLDELQAEIAYFRLKHLKKINNYHNKIANIYIKNLSHILDVPFMKSYEVSSFHNFIIKVKKRNSLMKYLNSNGIETKIHYPKLLHLQPCSKNLKYKRGDFPIAENLNRKILSLPIYYGLCFEKVKKVCNLILKFYEKEQRFKF